MAKYPSSCFEDIICPDCKEHTTRHEPCCSGTPTCDCIECVDCGELLPELDENDRCDRCVEKLVPACCDYECRGPCRSGGARGEDAI